VDPEAARRRAAHTGTRIAACSVAATATMLEQVYARVAASH